MILFFIIPIVLALYMFLFSWEMFIPDRLFYILLAIDIIGGIVAEYKHIKNKNNHKDYNLKDDDFI